jgi:drug/metabolite transporter (DMT)-like permease
MASKSWVFYITLLVIFWGVWGAFSALPATLYRYPDQMIYIVWAFTMLIPCYFILRKNKFEYKPITALYGMLIGLTGAGGQLVLFKALTIGPAYLIFPVVSISPAITVFLALLLLRERIAWLGWLGVLLALASIILLSVPDGSSGGLHVGTWLALALLVCVCWGAQAFWMKCAANAGASDATTFAYMTLSGILLVPVAYWTMPGTGFDFPWQAPALTAGTQVLNAVGALFLVMAMSRGKAVIVAPCANALAPILTIVLSLMFYRTFPSIYSSIGIVLALGGSTLMIYTDSRRGSMQGEGVVSGTQ